MELDDRLPIVWDTSLDVEGELAEQLCSAFEFVRLECASRLKAADLAAKMCCGFTTLLVGVCFAEGDSIYCRKCEI